MKKKKWIWLVAALLLAILVVPIPSGVYKDGGTREYTALTYKIVRWNRLIGSDGIYNETKVYFFPDNFESIDSLWAEEEREMEHSFAAEVLEITENFALVQPLPGEAELNSSDQISFSLQGLEDIGTEVGSVVQITYTGDILETYPAQIYAKSWSIAKDLRGTPYSGTWLDKSTAVQEGNDFFSDIVITQIYSDCFFARTVIPLPYEIKINGSLPDHWCVGDQVLCTYENTYFDQETYRIEADLITIETSNLELDPDLCYKPVIYLYPEEEMPVSVKLNLDGELTCTYPSYGEGWKVTARPDGTLVDQAGQTYSYLYWEGQTYARWDMSRGFCVKGEDTAAFLEDALEKLGLTRREANEFIVYWLPLMQDNPYNIISFQEDAYTQAAKLDIEPKPDTLIRVFMAYKPSDSFVELEAQELTAPERAGFTAVEWGGAQVQ